ncbi:hypothetical protein [uncultured Pontibacter sp.]|uniref:hypothetical protein n=1 Tax=uncultured Pontibacter sp. TaxID=453356 RepID=UPI0026147FCD|nr:hypothetical protein [uncultured Pontibacter sp.]
MFYNYKRFCSTFVLLLTFSLATILTSCDVLNTAEELIIPVKHEDAFQIKKGQHSSNSPHKSINTQLIRFEATFDSSAIYTSVKPENQADINKLYGVSDCGSHHHTNSARFGWRWYNGKLEILAYTYVNKKRDFKLIRSVEIGQTYKYELRLEDKQYVFLVDGVKTVMPRNCSGAGNGYQLYPYFGGDEVAPHDIKIAVKDLL